MHANDSENLQIALKAISIRSDIQVVIRIFDEDFAKSLHDQFGFTALSENEMAAPIFASAAAGMDVTYPTSIEGQQLSLARLTISKGCILVRQSGGFIEDTYHLNIVFVRFEHNSVMHPSDSRLLIRGDLIGVLGGPKQLGRLLHDNT